MAESSVDLRYPIGKFKLPESIDHHQREQAIASLRDTPAHLKAAVTNLTDAQLDIAYREGGWTVRQVVHHLADVNMSTFLRTRQALTTDQPPITQHPWDAWALLPDSLLPVAYSVELLDGLHRRWVALLLALSDEQWSRTLSHPVRGPVTVQQLTLLYAWHARHHIAHITHLRVQQGW